MERMKVLSHSPFPHRGLTRMLDELKRRVCAANLKLVEDGLVVHTFGNASGIDRAAGCLVIKHSGVPYKDLKPSHMV